MQAPSEAQKYRIIKKTTAEQSSENIYFVFAESKAYQTFLSF